MPAFFIEEGGKKVLKKKQTKKKILLRENGVPLQQSKPGPDLQKHSCFAVP